MGGQLLQLRDSVVMIADAHGGYSLWLVDRTARGGCQPDYGTSPSTTATPRRVECACANHADALPSERCAGNGPALLLAYPDASPTAPKRLPDAGQSFVEFGRDRLLSFPPAASLGWDAKPLPAVAAAAPIAAAAAGWIDGGTRVTVWARTSEAGLVDASESEGEGASGGGLYQAWLGLGGGTTGPAPCMHNDCAACVTDAGCGWCAERHQCMQGGDEAACNGDECPNSMWMPHSCSAVGIACGTFSSCGECTVNDDCGWCASELRCVSKDEREQSCPGRGALFLQGPAQCDGGLNAPGWSRR